MLGIAALAVVPDFAWNAVVAPLLTPNARFVDFQTFQQAARRMSAGVSPYIDFIGKPPDDPVRNGTYVYPPFFAWMLQPVGTWTGDARALFVVASDLVLLAVALTAVLVALRVRDRQAWLLAALLTAGFFPVIDNFYWGQVSILLLALGALWFWAYVEGERWWGAAALGIAVAIKLIQAPLLLGWVVRRRWRPVAVAAVAAGGVLLLGGRWLPEWALQVFPAVSGGTGWMGNIAPTGVLLRIVDPGSFTSHEWVTVPAVKVIAGALAVGLLGADLLLARRLPEGRERRAVEAALLIATLPLLSPLTWGGHLALQIVPLVVVGWVGIRRRIVGALAVAAVAVLLMGPANAWYWQLAGSGALSYSVWAQPLADVPAVGVALGWVAVAWAAWSCCAIRRRMDVAREAEGRIRRRMAGWDPAQAMMSGEPPR